MKIYMNTQTVELLLVRFFNLGLFFSLRPAAHCPPKPPPPPQTAEMHSPVISVLICLSMWPVVTAGKK